MNPMIKTSHLYHETNEAIPVMVKLKQVVMPLIKLIQDNNTTNKLPLHYQVYADMNPRLLSVHDHQVILEKIEARENLNHDEYVEEEDFLLLQFFVHDHQVILEKFKQEKILTMMNMWKKKINKMLIVMNPILMTINNSYFIFNIFWTPSGGTALIECKTPTNVIS